MTAHPTPAPASTPDELAAEVAIGLIDESVIDPALAADPAFQRAVTDWRERLAPLDRTAAPLAPEPALWARIRDRLVTATATPELAAAPAPIRRAARTQPGRGFLAELWESLSFWRYAGIAGALATLVLAVGLSVMAERANRKPVMIAVLLTEQNETSAIVNISADGTGELIPMMNFAVPEGRAIEIWTLWDKAIGPRSIGLIERSRSVRLDLRNLPRPQPGQLFEMTLEPAGGSPIGRPTGPILNKGLTATAL